MNFLCDCSNIRRLGWTIAYVDLVSKRYVLGIRIGLGNGIFLLLFPSLIRIFRPCLRFDLMALDFYVLSLNIHGSLPVFYLVVRIQ